MCTVYVSAKKGRYLSLSIFLRIIHNVFLYTYPTTCVLVKNTKKPIAKDKKQHYPIEKSGCVCVNVSDTVYNTVARDPKLKNLSISTQNSHSRVHFSLFCFLFGFLFSFSLLPSFYTVTDSFIHRIQSTGR